MTMFDHVGILVLVVYFARKKSCWQDCVAPDEKAVEVIGTSYNGTIDRNFRGRENADPDGNNAVDDEEGNAMGRNENV